MKINIVWLRRDLRLEDNTAIYNAINPDFPTLLLFIFDSQIIDDLERDDPRVNFIYDELEKINTEIKKADSGVLLQKGKPNEIFEKLNADYDINKVFWNHDYEPYAINRDQEITTFLEKHGIASESFKDQVIFEGNDVLKDDGKPYTVFSPFKRKWLKKFTRQHSQELTYSLEELNLLKTDFEFSLKDDIGIQPSEIKVLPYHLDIVEDYENIRDKPSINGTSLLSPHLRFGTVSVRKIVNYALDRSETFLSELIWREFFMQILYHFPNTVSSNFKPKYDTVKWRNNEAEFEKWCKGETGYPIVDAGMKELNTTGYMHNRVRMIVASFLCKHLLIDWRWGEAYFAKKLLDFELSSNVGNWQWAASTGCDAVPYFRIFNPTSQVKKFDPKMDYIRKWCPEFQSLTYPQPIVEHSYARERALDTYKTALS
ncbi:cryptochrome/photolyase family protein [Sediminitomix flava]|uniref:Deoxyribodipyrimidine photo-lyase n=1 Tax=Sediminitomix flava TaxID=379075 RepID=A0A315Z6P4_SEDFL|nr:deoxyribodipyrimidine photo-lyase [Sediminitomix flava]PWJ38425.1 deoxyribodipyrimidine photo-lyase [Sediminitomix flava]